MRVLSPLAWVFAAAALPALGVAVASGSTPAPTAGPPAEPPDFVRDVQPILAAACVRWHGPDRHRAGLRLDTREGLLGGGESGPPVVPGDAAASLLYRPVGRSIRSGDGRARCQRAKAADAADP